MIRQVITKEFDS